MADHMVDRLWDSVLTLQVHPRWEVHGPLLREGEGGREGGEGGEEGRRREGGRGEGEEGKREGGRGEGEGEGEERREGREGREGGGRKEEREGKGGGRREGGREGGVHVTMWREGVCVWWSSLLASSLQRGAALLSIRSSAVSKVM